MLDCELLVPGVAPAGWQQAARAALHRVGAHRLAERIGSAEAGLWRAVERYAASPVRGNETLAELFAELGEPSLRLTWEGPDDGMVTVVPGPGGGEEFVAPCGEARCGSPPRICPLRPGPSSRWRCAITATRAGERLPRHAWSAGAVMRAAVARLQRLAPTGMPVLLLGESGTGKEPRHASPPRQPPHRTVPARQLRRLTETLIHSELFGHARGRSPGPTGTGWGCSRAPGAGRSSSARSAICHSASRSSLLRCCRSTRCAGSASLPRKVDVRLVAATTAISRRWCDGGTFREDLFFRLKVARVELPPLRERGDDVLLLAEVLLARIAGADPVPRLAPEARERLRSHRWPGNVRELENVLRFAAVLAEGGVIRAADLDLEGPEEEAAPREAGEYHRRIEEYRRELLVAAMRAHDGRQAAAARWLGISRQTLSYLLRRFDLEGPW